MALARGTVLENAREGRFVDCFLTPIASRDPCLSIFVTIVFPFFFEDWPWECLSVASKEAFVLLSSLLCEDAGTTKKGERGRGGKTHAVSREMMGVMGFFGLLKTEETDWAEGRVWVRGGRAAEERAEAGEAGAEGVNGGEEEGGEMEGEEETARALGRGESHPEDERGEAG